MNNRSCNSNKASRKRLRFGPTDFSTITHQIFHYANSGVFRDEFMREVSKILLKFSGCDAIELWLKEHNKYYQSQVENPQQSFRFSTIQIPKDEKKQPSKAISALNICVIILFLVINR